MKFPLQLLAFLLFYFTTFSQVRDSVQEKHIKFFQNISKNGGVWVAENPKYD